MQQRHRSAQGLGIVSAPAAGARVQPQPGIARQQVVPVLEVALDVQVLVHALAIRALVEAPVVQRFEVEILAIDLDPVVLDQPAHVIGQPLAAGRDAQVEQPVLGALDPQQPLRALHIEPRAGAHPLGLKPDQQIGALSRRVIGDGLEPVGEALGIGLPASGDGDLRS